MRPFARTLAVIGLAALAIAGGFAAGWWIRGGSPAASSGPLAFAAAGTLAPFLPSLAAQFANETPGVAAPLAAQLYEGSVDGAIAVRTPGSPYDAFLAADFRVIPQWLESNGAAGFELVFASDPLVLAYNNQSGSPLQGLNSTNWPTRLEQPGVTLGAPNASSDPLGANAIFVLELEDDALHANGQFFRHFYSGGIGGFAVPTSSTKIVPETQAAVVLRTDEVQAYFVYRSYAFLEHLANVSLPVAVNLGGVTSADVQAYGAVSTEVLNGSAAVIERGAPVLFAVTVPANAPDFPLGVAFVGFLLANSSASAWERAGFLLLNPIWADHPSDLPGALSGIAPNGVPSLPSYLAALI